MKNGQMTIRTVLQSFNATNDLDRLTAQSPALENKEVSGELANQAPAFASADAAAIHHRAMVPGRRVEELAELQKQVYLLNDAGRMDDIEAMRLSQVLQVLMRGRPVTRPFGPFPRQGVNTARFAPRRYTRRRTLSIEQREAAARRRNSASGYGCIPNEIRELLNDGARAVTSIICGQIKHHGYCDLAIEAIAAMAGMCRTTARNAIKQLEKLKVISVDRDSRRGVKSRTNIIRIICPHWLAWLKRGSAPYKPRYATQGVNALNVAKKMIPTKIKDLKKEGYREKTRSKIPRVLRI